MKNWFTGGVAKLTLDKTILAFTPYVPVAGVKLSSFILLTKAKQLAGKNEF